MELNRGDYKNLKKVEDPNAECFKCGAKEEIYEDPNIEGMYFCKNCWEERIKTEILTELGMEEEIPFED
jgi:hypothetical protein